jgi:hypothetical protein
MTAIRFAFNALLTGWILWTSIPATAAEDKKKDSQQNPTSASAQTLQAAIVSSVPRYKPPARGAPLVRVSGSSRGAAQRTLSLEVLAPPHTGLTRQVQPDLYWYLSQPALTPVEAVLIDEQDNQAVRPLLEIHLDPPVQPGIHRFRLADYGVELKPAVTYRWSVAIVPDAGQRSNDIVASGAIQRIAPSRSLDARLAQASPQDHAFLYAEEGLWYDAIAAISELIESRPDAPSLRGQRAALLEQVDLPGAATYDRKHGRGK